LHKWFTPGCFTVAWCPKAGCFVVKKFGLVLMMIELNDTSEKGWGETEWGDAQKLFPPGRAQSNGLKQTVTSVAE